MTRKWHPHHAHVLNPHILYIVIIGLGSYYFSNYQCLPTQRYIFRFILIDIWYIMTSGIIIHLCQCHSYDGYFSGVCMLVRLIFSLRHLGAKSCFVNAWEYPCSLFVVLMHLDLLWQKVKVLEAEDRV